MHPRLAETFEYHNLIDLASGQADSTTRMLLVAVWQLSSYNSQTTRENKPFNPLLGETFEWTSRDEAVRLGGAFVQKM